ncbi:DNA (cytosine-5)-methyltransferase CMT3 [Argentina anserina]|uniref:DNA (cytosine-5)-methyltransferase CMT3 n=1 Tax=Argentina anserina TaxID=57926 RepID=UPI0021762305|nr:DNA (cytosine-5)-methyltransferase CMT3 [Potentilla anserina]
MPSKRKANRSPASSSADKKKPKLPPPEEAVSGTEIETEIEETKLKSRARVEKIKQASPAPSPTNADDEDAEISDAKFLGEPIEAEEARRRWPLRYIKPPTQIAKPLKKKKSDDDEEELIVARRHYARAEVDGIIYELNDDAHVKGVKGEKPYICKITEFFEGVDDLLYFTAQWFYRANDTVIGDKIELDSRRIYYSEVTNCNYLECLLEKLEIARFGLDADPDVRCKLIENCTYFCDTKYMLPYSSFINFPPENTLAESENSSTISSEIENNSVLADNSEHGGTSTIVEQGKPEVTLLDLYSGCGGMSTGLCLGANLADLNLVTRWAVDMNPHALKSLKKNHTETEVREECAEDFLTLLKMWRTICVHFKVVKPDGSEAHFNLFTKKDVKEEDGEEEAEDEDVEANDDNDAEAFEVEKILSIRYGKPVNREEKELLFKVQWKGYGPEYDTWEPLDLLTGCEESIQEFVSHVYHSKLLPQPGDVDVVCGGPPCQGISGYNRFRNYKNPLDDDKNQQLMVFMDIVDYLKPKYVLMENVVDLLKFSDGFLGRYALGRLVGLNYQARMGMMSAGAYGLPQFRMRVFLWGALPTEMLPQFPLPTHDVVFKGQIPTKWEQSTVAYSEGHNHPLRKKLLLEDALTDLPEVENDQPLDEMPYGKPPQTDFQRFIRLSKDGLLENLKFNLSKSNEILYDHRPLNLNVDDHERVCFVPKEKGACFRNLPGVLVGDDNKVYWDPNVERVKLKSGKPLVPNYAMTFVSGSSSKPFGRLWWDEIVSTVVTRAEPHNQSIMHPIQDRVLTIRENARLQGFPDYYQFSGPIKQRYMQVGNAVAVPVSRALGYALGLAFRGLADGNPLFELPKDMHLPDGCLEDGDYVGDLE